MHYFRFFSLLFVLWRLLCDARNLRLKTYNGQRDEGGMKSERSPRPCTRRINKKHMLFDWLVFGNLPFRIDKLLAKQTRARLLALIATTHCHHTSNKNPPTRGSNSSGHTNIQMSFSRLNMYLHRRTIHPVGFDKPDVLVRAVHCHADIRNG